MTDSYSSLEHSDMGNEFDEFTPTLSLESFQMMMRDVLLFRLR